MFYCEFVPKTQSSKTVSTSSPEWCHSHLYMVEIGNRKLKIVNGGSKIWIIVKWWKQYLMNAWAQWGSKYCFHHEKIKIISSSHRVNFSFDIGTSTQLHSQALACTCVVCTRKWRHWYPQFSDDVGKCRLGPGYYSLIWVLCTVYFPVTLNTCVYMIKGVIWNTCRVVHT